MSTPTSAPHEVPAMVPAGRLQYLLPAEIKPSTHNPRRLFDHAQLLELKTNIAEHGVLVPLTVFQSKGQKTFSILDGERRYRCVLELTEEGRLGKDGKPMRLPANVVEPPSKVAGLLYMFSIHNIREAWELMPTALGLKTVIDELKPPDNKSLSKLTGLSEPQIERCRTLLAFPEKFQNMSLDPDPVTRIPSNFWIEAKPVIDLAVEKIPVIANLGFERATDKLVEKYRARKIKSVIHFRRVIESYDLNEGDPATLARVMRRIEEFFLNPTVETRSAFDEFILDKKRIQSALALCNEFIEKLQALKVRHMADDDERSDLRSALKQVRDYCNRLEEDLRGSDDPDVTTAVANVDDTV
ncbi:MAG TPA: ParB N-terminal domain-containing protein [Acidobacteriaceae bacterium]